MNASFDDKKVDKISKALGDPYRIKIIQLLIRRRRIGCSARPSPGCLI
jgi:hypothetical protein